MVPSLLPADDTIRPLRAALVAATNAVQAHLGTVAPALERPGHAAGVQSDQSLSQLLASADALTLAWLAGVTGENPERAIGALRITSALAQIDQVLSRLTQRPPHRSAGRSELAEPLHHAVELILVELAAARDGLLAGDAGTALHVLDEVTCLDGWHDVLIRDILEEAADASLSIDAAEELLAISRALACVSEQVREISENAVVLAGDAIH